MMTIYTDGACSGNPGPGGWGVVICDSENAERTLSGACVQTTNNRMELTAAIEGLRAVLGCGPVTLISDSRYVIDGITRWIVQWEKNGWKTSQKKPVENQDLWQTLKALADQHTELKFQWIQGHSGDPYNDRADLLATTALKEGFKK